MSAGVRALLPALALLLAAPAGCVAQRDLVLAATTSLRDSGLLDKLLALFAERTGIRVQPVVVGSGAALRIASEGNADVLLTHAPERERALVAEGVLVDRRPFMENHFVLAGPPDDPAGVRGAPSAAEGIRRIAAAGAPFVSRGDDSGTHWRERALLRAAGLDPDGGWRGFARTGTGMGLSLQVAGERRAYVLSDIATFRAVDERAGLAILSAPEPALRNVYSVSRPSPERFAGRVRVDDAVRFADFLFSPAARELIAGFGRDEGGAPLFLPVASGAPREVRAP